MLPKNAAHLALGLLIVCGLAMTLVPARLSQDEAQRHLEQVVTRLQAQGRAGNPCKPTGRDINELAVLLADAAKLDKRLLDCIDVLFRDNDELDGAWRGERLSRRKRDIFGSYAGVRGLLDVLHITKPHVFGTTVVERKHEINLEQFIRLPKREQDSWLLTLKRVESNPELAASRGLDLELEQILEDNREKEPELAASPRGLETARRLFEMAARMGLRMFDHFSTTHDFLADLPLIGDQLSKLREKGEPILHLARVLRQGHNLYKIRKGIQIVARDGSIQSEQETKEMLMRSGVAALKSIFDLVMARRHGGATAGQKESGEDSRRLESEFTARTFYAVAAMAIDKQACKRSPSERPAAPSSQ